MILKRKQARVLKSDRGQILLSPIEQIPDRELWLWQNPAALNSVLRGIEQAAAGEVHDLGSFAQYADLEIGQDTAMPCPYVPDI